LLISLDDVPKHTEMEVGLKAWNLSKVKATGARVPFTVIIPSDVISQLMSESGIRHDIFKLSRIVMDSDSPEKAFELEKEIRSKINSLSIPEDLLDGIMDTIAGNVEKMIVARPSPYASELVDGDLKGRMGVWYDEPTKKGIVRSIQRVLGGSFSLRAIARMMDLGVYPEDLDLAIMIQKVIFPRSSGIAICCPARRRNEILVESTWGSMNGVPKDRFRISMDLMEVVESELSEKKVKLVPSPQGIREVEVPHHLWMEPSVKGGEIEEIARTSSDLSLILGTPTLMEWIIQEGTDVLFVIQAHKEPERPPVKPLERKVMNWLEERREVREIKEEKLKEVVKEVELSGRPGKVAPREVEVSPVALVASKIYVRYPVELPRGLVDGRIVEVDELSRLGPGDHIVILRDSSNIGDLGEVKVLVEADNPKEAKEKLFSIAASSPSSEFLIYLGKAELVLMSDELSDIYDGAVLPVDLEGFSAALSIASRFDHLMVDLKEEVPSVDLVREALSAGVEGFLLGVESVEGQVRVIHRAEMRHLLEKLRYLELLLSEWGELGA